jgi:hypothetical protein
LMQCGDRRPEADSDGLTQDVVEVAVADRNARPSFTPQRGQVDVEKFAAPVVEESLAADLVGAIAHLVMKPEPAERTDRVGRQVHPGPRVRPCRDAVDDVGLNAVLKERPGSRQSGDPAAHYEDTPRIHDHIRIVSLSATAMGARWCNLLACSGV